jgi:hypothetical protein
MLRRALAGGSLVGASSIAGWSVPVIRSVTLPAHAATSEPVGRSLSRFSMVVDVQIGLRGQDPAAGSLLADAVRRVGNTIVPVALAAEPPYRRFALIERPGVRYDFYLLQTEPAGEGCYSEMLFFATALVPFVPAITSQKLCNGDTLSGPEVELVDLIDDEATIRLGSEGAFTMLLDRGAKPLALMPCPPCMQG